MAAARTGTVGLADLGAETTTTIAGTGALSVLAPSKSRYVAETINGSQHFTINGYSLVKGMGFGKHIASETFTVGGYQWAIYFYPDGKNAEDNSLYVSVFIALASEGTDVRALFELTLLDQSGKGRHKVHSHFDRSLEGGPYTLKYRGSMWGYKRFFRREALETSDFLKNDTLEIKCTVGVVQAWTQGSKIYSIPTPEPELGKDFGALLESGEDTDITLEVDGEDFKAHKLILAARSPVFKAQLFGPMGDRNTDTLCIKDIQAPVFKAMLHFIYTDTLPDVSEAEASGVSSSSMSASASTIMAQHLLAAADCYGLDRLRLMCESRLCENVSVDTVATTLALAEQHHASQLKAVCLKFAAENLAGVMQSDGFDYMLETCPLLQSELLQTVAGVEKAIGSNRKSSMMSWGSLPDGTDGNGRRVRQKL